AGRAAYFVCDGGTGAASAASGSDSSALSHTSHRDTDLGSRHARTHITGHVHIRAYDQHADSPAGIHRDFHGPAGVAVQKGRAAPPTQRAWGRSRCGPGDIAVHVFALKQSVE